MSRRVLLSALLLVAGITQAAPEQVPLYREIKDWVVACDNLRGCQALSAPESFGYSSFSLQLERAAGAQAPLRLSLHDAEQDGYAPLRLDGRALSTADRLHPIENQGETTLVAEGADAQAVLAELRNGVQLRMERERDYEAVVSLSGLSAALLLMDAVQGRLDSRSALYRPGSRPDSEVPAAPQAPRLRAYPGVTPLSEVEQRDIAEQVMAATRSQWFEEDMSSEPEAEAFALNDREALVIIRTWCAAYNCDFAVYRVGRQAPYAERDLQLEPPPLDLGALSGWVSYNPDTGELGYLYKGRGIADCGESGSWRFDGERFQLASLNFLGRCAARNPGEWPELWRVAEP
ncbi:DUF1176 domain-containing protein [Ectopseudomonas mendocina]|uniref:DUF1176 domain-containing protein n=1 Tax=Ectopseudomonas mendocina S5.2 TaxID=1225174 RepID=A0ABN4J0I1_ECTME|nr:DUF1176 domain-containing protein [Pseudomonas mendocina]ALN21578.1 hypothetical protein DW68_007565 [Pseudomonas mendocina S5.2]KES00665.1 hypothetical protein HN51_12665 [Pseudomonas mendocina]